ncbi:hypothetical protein NECAME_08389 [Necator americanus]|uniref:Uncharacterized protein n=1 Tax=Necator americanus TaxID=51031 RepID=W2TK91_NECAM|nr:hypothetical protein NECAME_08389 [Necator americanus]ETN81591.1 hypothetical protein NECAME_08389 [Necator americanus]
MVCVIASTLCKALLKLSLTFLIRRDSTFKMIAIADGILKSSGWLLFSLTLAFFHAIMLSALFINQCVQISENMTTMDRIRHSRGRHYAHLNSESDDNSPDLSFTFSRRIRNVVDFCIASF